ncbi:MAG: Ig-like domain-containing protein [Bacteroidales bacterium]|nr:Ig-like domain-containing protein [Bacteroidales bacterium]
MKICRKKKRLIGFFIWAGLIIALIAGSCAKPVAPTGGPKDTTPPVVKEAIPPNYSTNFNRKEIEIEFNEFIQLEGVNQKLIVSPPMEEDPDINNRGKSVIIELKDTLKENTTYRLYFGDAIVDFHESNPLENFQYVFSTGDVVDSMKVSGKLIHAKSKNPAKDVFVMLYTEKRDSVPIKKRPLYLTKTNEKGFFELTNLKDTSYKIFALDDANANYKYDLPNEKIAFTDSIIQPREVTIMKSYKMADTAKEDSLTSPPKDSLRPPDGGITLQDTMKKTPRKTSKDTLTLSLFRDRDTTLKITTSTLKKDEKVILGFNKPIDSLKLNALKPEMKPKWYIPEWNRVKDSVLLWLTDFDSDSLVFSFDMDSTLSDTLTFTYFEESKKKESEEPVLKINPLLQKNVQIPIHPLRLEFSKPLSDTIEIDSLYLYSSEDTTKVPYEREGIREVIINHSWQEEMNYRLYIPGSAFRDIYGTPNDSTLIKFSTKPKDKFGTLIINASVPYDSTTTTNYIVKLMSFDEKETYQTVTFNSDSTLKFDFLDPGKYKLKAIVDRNRNKIWDPGLYTRHEQPEAIIYFEEAIEVMANWEVEYDWKIKP